LTYVLDTNIFIAGLNGNVAVLRRLDALNPEDIVLCAPVLAELEYGACFSVRKETNLLEECKEEGSIVITRNGKAVAILLAPIDDDDLEGLLLARSPRFQALLDKSRASIQGGKGLSSRQFWDTVAKRQGERASGNEGSRSKRRMK